ncbi:MAG: hypothetical protein COY66_00035 [Candidatus Kerfeldbacteria bacterium CG_4_10_14_0_8_um_filter_42_10]|uniref:DUF4352 domain-containing protein n=1 Tax=Candidatus Kerfeldbacteria bacterium CG_4_10_14_0_8_um_filter_42_10 TaxID=2014248 RepID=A0A2M7RL11_9BACT|nr:MAG: hypothetical protein COY66_00035 [Candidatus Kerfeldbacteria bacterium CG_4_10_14_0_8_um_filter_42_10]
MKKSPINKKPIKEIGVWTVTCWIFIGLAGLISVFSGIVTIKAGQLFIGILFLVFGVFVFVPRKYLRISRPLKVIIFISAYFTLLVISGINTPKPEQQYEYYSLEQPFNLTFGNNIFSMKINNVSKETQIIVNNEQTISSSGFYLFVNGEITNLGKVTSDLQFKSELKDSEDNLYIIFATDTRVGGFQPNLEKKFYNVFEIPRQASGLKFFVKDKTNVIKVVNLE